MLLCALIAMKTCSPSFDRIPGNNICTNDALFCLRHDLLSTSEDLSPWVYVALLILCMRRDGTGTIHAVLSTAFQP